MPKPADWRLRERGRRDAGLADQRQLYDVDYYPGGTTGTMTKINSLFTSGSTFYASTP